MIRVSKTLCGFVPEDIPEEEAIGFCMKFSLMFFHMDFSHRSSMLFG
jgi:hypothetical protein